MTNTYPIALATLLLACLAIRPALAADNDPTPPADRLAEWGFLDVTAAPYSADPSGERDSTDALQRAIDFARDHQLVAFFPPGTYLVRDTLTCIHGRHDPVTLEVRHKSRDFPCVLFGSRSGPQRPRIVLAPNAPGFGDPEHPKYVIHFWARGLDEAPPTEPQPNINMNQMLVGIDVTIGPGNAGAVAVRNRAAQGSGIEDCTIDATHGYCGLEGGAGSGGSHANVTVIGGRIGVDLRETQPASTITGFTLRGQTQAAILYAGRQSLAAVGLRIETDTHGPVIVGQRRWGAHNGQMCLVDCSVDFHEPGNNTLVDTTNSLYLGNVYVHGAKTIVRQAGKPDVDVPQPGWLCIHEYAAGVPSRYRARSYENRTFDYPAPIYVDGQRVEQPAIASVGPVDAPPGDLVARHVWDDKFPTWESPEAVNVKEPPYNAVGDGATDDADAIQRAVDQHDLVFLPKGTYAVSRTIRLRPETKLLGAFRCFTWLAPLPGAKGIFADRDAPQPVLQTADRVDARTVVAFLGIRTDKEAPGAYCLRWQSGRESIFRNVNTVLSVPWTRRTDIPRYNIPLVLVDGHGGGRWYNFHQESSRLQGPDYRHLLAVGTTEPMHFYQCNPEHARGDANMELRDCRYVSIYGLKGEYNRPILAINGCDHVRLFGYGGNAAAREGTALFVVRDTPNFLLANLVDSPRMPQGVSDDFFAGDGVDPRRWYMFQERTPDGQNLHTAPLERPVLYRRGEPRAGDRGQGVGDRE